MLTSTSWTFHPITSLSVSVFLLLSAASEVCWHLA
nr:MAG TPA: hypothetical protein [Caudoviricetes sp.]